MPSPMTMFLVVSLVVSLVAIFGIVRAEAEDIRALRKPLWYVVALVPIVGAVGWWMAGRPQNGPSGKRVAKDRERRGKRQKISADRQVILDRLSVDQRARTNVMASTNSPPSPGSLADRAARSAASAVEASATSPSSASYRD